MALAACLGLVSQLVALVHLWLVPHTRCAEHGETIHDDRPHAPRLARTPNVLAVDDASSESSLEDGHDHCQILTERRAPGGSHVTSVAGVTSIVDAPFVVGERPEGAGPPLYRIAPKVSPPALHA